jgi:hypothetical protein
MIIRLGVGTKWSMFCGEFARLLETQEKELARRESVLHIKTLDPAAQARSGR